MSMATLWSPPVAKGVSWRRSDGRWHVIPHAARRSATVRARNFELAHIAQRSAADEATTEQPEAIVAVV